MKTLALCFVAALIGCAYAEPPSGYHYSRPSGGYSGGGHGGGHGGGFTGGFTSGGGGFSTNEGLNVDSNVLEQVRQILVKNEGSHGGLSSSYGAPGQSSYYRGGHGGVLDISLGDIRQAIQVAQFSQSHTVPVASYPSSSYGVPSSSYGAPARIPSSSYGAPSY